MIHGDIRILFKCEAIEFGGKTKHSVNHIVKFEIWAQLLLVIGIFGITEFIGVVAVVPWLQFDFLPFES